MTTKEKFSIRIERELFTDNGWAVIKYHRTGKAVLFRGALDRCQDYARELVDDLRHTATAQNSD